MQDPCRTIGSFASAAGAFVGKGGLTFIRGSTHQGHWMSKSKGDEGHRIVALETAANITLRDRRLVVIAFGLCEGRHAFATRKIRHDDREELKRIELHAKALRSALRGASPRSQDRLVLAMVDEEFFEMLDWIISTARNAREEKDPAAVERELLEMARAAGRGPAAQRAIQREVRSWFKRGRPETPWIDSLIQTLTEEFVRAGGKTTLRHSDDGGFTGQYADYLEAAYKGLSRAVRPHSLEEFIRRARRNKKGQSKKN